MEYTKGVRVMEARTARFLAYGKLRKGSGPEPDIYKSCGVPSRIEPVDEMAKPATSGIEWKAREGGRRRERIEMRSVDMERMIPESDLSGKVDGRVRFVDERLAPYDPAHGRPDVEPISLFKMQLAGYVR